MVGVTSVHLVNRDWNLLENGDNKTLRLMHNLFMARQARADVWVEKMVDSYDLGHTVRERGRPRKN